MHTIEFLEQALALAEAHGFTVRQDWFGGAPSGLCEVKGRRWLCIDLALSPAEQLEQALEALRSLPVESPAGASPQLQRLLKLRKAA